MSTYVSFFNMRFVLEATLPMIQATLERQMRRGGALDDAELSPPAVLLLWEMKRLGLRPLLEHPVGPYDLDFYFPEARLCAEVDGRHHLSRQAEDRWRDGYVAREGIETRRVPLLNHGYLTDSECVDAPTCAAWIRDLVADRRARLDAEGAVARSEVGVAGDWVDDAAESVVALLAFEPAQRRGADERLLGRGSDPGVLVDGEG